MFFSQWITIFTAVVILVQITGIFSAPKIAPRKTKSEKLKEEIVKEIREKLKSSKNNIVKEVAIDIKTSDIDLKNPVQVEKVFGSIRRKLRSPENIQVALQDISIRLNDSKNPRIKDIVEALNNLDVENISGLVRKNSPKKKRIDSTPNPVESIPKPVESTPKPVESIPKPDNQSVKQTIEKPEVSKPKRIPRRRKNKVEDAAKSSENVPQSKSEPQTKTEATDDSKEFQENSSPDGIKNDVDLNKIFARQNEFMKNMFARFDDAMDQHAEVIDNVFNTSSSGNFMAQFVGALNKLAEDGNPSNSRNNAS